MIIELIGLFSFCFLKEIIVPAKPKPDNIEKILPHNWLNDRSSKRKIFAKFCSTAVGFTREQSYKIVQKHALQAWKENSSFYDKIIADKNIIKKIPVNKIKKLFDFGYHTKKINIIFNRSLKK